MKRCPQCNRVETDEALKFCRVDGAPLTVSTALDFESATMALPGSGSAVPVTTHMQLAAVKYYRDWTDPRLQFLKVDPA